jgi:hypothetical protein
MTNASIYAAFERMWQHITNLVGKQIADVKTSIGISANYYTELSTAISDINNGVTTNSITDMSAAKVKVFPADNGRTTVMLLDNVSESVQIDINKDIDLVLNGKTLIFTQSGAHLRFENGTNCIIYGEIDGSRIEKYVQETTINEYVINSVGILEINGGDYYLEIGSSVANICIRVDPLCEHITMNNCNISNKNTGTTKRNISARVVQNQGLDTHINNCKLYAVTSFNHAVAITSAGTLYINNSELIADAPDYDASTRDSSAIALDFRDGSNAYITNCIVYGTHSGLQNKGNLYINGGIYGGFCHGGIYFCHGAEYEAFVNDATIRCGYYEGQFDYSNRESDVLGSFYIGGGTSNVTSYLDNCIFDTEYGNAFVIRGSSGETNNTVNVSNSTILNNKIVRVDNETHKLNIGVGCNFTAADVDNPNYAEVTNELYRKNHKDKDLDGNDYNAIINVFEGSTLPTVTTDNNGSFLRVIDGAWNISSIPNAEEAEF